MKSLWKYSGWYLVVIGIIHNLVIGYILFDILQEMAGEWFINTVISQMDRNAAFWALFAGFFFIYVGLQWQESLRENKKPLSKLTAWGFSVIVFFSLIIVPVSGFWLVLPLCAGMLYPHYAKN